MPTGSPIITASGVWRSYGDGKGIRGLDLEVPRGTLFGLVGPSGAGKTTIVRLLLGTLAPEKGFLSVLGRLPADFTREDRSRIGYLAQTPALHPELSLRHNLDLVASLYGVPWRGRASVLTRRGREARRSVADALAFVELSDRQRLRFAAASGGEQRRLGLAAAVVHGPELLVLDEPTAGVDPVLRQRIWAKLAGLRDEGATVLVTTQYVEEAAYCDLVALVVDGRTLVVGTPEALRGLAFGGDVDADTTFDDVFVELVLRHRLGSTEEGRRG